MTMKLFTIIIACLFTFPLTSTIITQLNNKSPSLISEQDINSSKDKIEKHDNLCVDISINNDGYYSLMSNAEIHYNKNNIDYIYISKILHC